jgi:hypothetical protein
MGNLNSYLTVTPSMLESFERCPHQFRHRYVDRIRPTGPVSVGLARGIATHELIAAAFEEYRRSGQFPVNLRERIETKLTRGNYADDGDWQADITTLQGWMTWAIAQVDPADTILATELWGEYDFPGDSSWPPFRLRHRVDLVLEHPNRSVTVVNWKTSRTMGVNDIECVSARIVAGSTFPDRPAITSATGFLVHRPVVDGQLDSTTIRAVWHRIKVLAAAIASETDFLPRSNALCPWCPAYQNGCPIQPSVSAGIDSITEWLSAIEAGT